MDYKFLIEQNEEYQDLYKKYNQILEEKRKALTKVNNETLKGMDLEKLDYTQLKELMDLMGYNVDDKLKDRLNKVYLLKKPYTNKVVEKMDFLNEEKKIQLDVNLSYFKNRYMTHAFWSKITYKKDVEDKIVKILLEDDLIRLDHRVRCPKCGNYLALLKEKDINYIKEFDELKLKIKEYEKSNKDENSEELEKLYDRYYDIEEGDNPLYRYCCECNEENEFEDLKDILKYSMDAYYIK